MKPTAIRADCRSGDAAAPSRSRPGEPLTDLWFVGSASPWGNGGYTSPAPPTGSWTWEVAIGAGSDQVVYARPLANSFANIGGDGYFFSGIVSYRAGGRSNPVGQSFENGVAPLLNAAGVDTVTFGWGLGGDDITLAEIVFEAWVSG
jgi:hypothetical protein